jgi:hypothetical protein
MTRPIIIIHNVETNEVIEREMTVTEFKAYEAEQAIKEAAQAEAETKAIARTAILERLGLTSEEAALILK